MPKTHDICAVVGEKKDGKPLWKNFGAIIEKDGKMYVKIEAIPLAEGFNGFFSAFTYTPKDDSAAGGQPPATKAAPGGGDFSDEIPFAKAGDGQII